MAILEFSRGLGTESAHSNACALSFVKSASI